MLYHSSWLFAPPCRDEASAQADRRQIGSLGKTITCHFVIDPSHLTSPRRPQIPKIVTRYVVLFNRHLSTVSFIPI
jgi:hypothetical protein